MKKLIVTLTMMVVIVGCAPRVPVNAEPEADAFYEKARLIMTKEEQNIYTHLPNEAARRQFEIEFWEKRDPTPDTPENENLLEFQERIAYANRWFRENRGKDKGWDTERGRILLQLGFPDERYFGDYTQANPYSGRLVSTNRIPMERWIYYRFNLVLVFADLKGFNELRLLRVPAGLLTALDLTKFTLDLRNRADLKRAFMFEAEYENGGIQIKIPVKKLSFKEEGDDMVADFKIAIHAYKDFEKTDTASREKTITTPKDKILNMKYLEFTIPYEFTQPGDYHLDVIIEEVATASKYRTFCRAKST